MLVYEAGTHVATTPTQEPVTQTEITTPKKIEQKKQTTPTTN